ncbi:MAG TPA: DUF917 domain-containing protein [Steroidobacteraceae bacterium]|nr:DUF917 domain-containing protein [Steroidobacteraceae bacterium]
MSDWLFGADDVEGLAAGCTLLGSGGGGDPHIFQMVLGELLAARGPVRVVHPDRLAADAQVVNVGFVGAPIVLAEKLFYEEEVTLALSAMSRRLGRRIDAIMAAEMAGANGLSAFIAASLLGVPVVDADGMGRAFPRSDQISYSIFGYSASPTVVSNEHGDVICLETRANARMEHLVRALSVAAGSKCFSVDYPLSGSDVRTCAIVGTVSLAKRLGSAIQHARESHLDLLAALQTALSESGDSVVRQLLEGKVTGCWNETRDGFGFGKVTLEALPSGEPMTVQFQNEFLVAYQGDRVLATTPDIISFVDTESLATITSDTARYGQRVKVLAIQAPPLLRSPAALRVVGPRAFGLDLDYIPIGTPP